MAEIVIRDLNPDTLERLKDRAKSNGSSLETEAKAILESAVPSPAAPARDPLEIVDYWHRRLAGRIHGDSADLLREDRFSMQEAREVLAQLRKSLAGQITGDSADLIREDRER